MTDEPFNIADLEGSEEYEEITSDEVDSVVETLEQLADSVTSENIRFYLEEACQRIYELIYDDEQLDDLDDQLSQAA